MNDSRVPPDHVALPSPPVEVAAGRAADDEGGPIEKKGPRLTLAEWVESGELKRISGYAARRRKLTSEPSPSIGRNSGKRGGPWLSPFGSVLSQTGGQRNHATVLGGLLPVPSRDGGGPDHPSTRAPRANHDAAETPAVSAPIPADPGAVGFTVVEWLESNPLGGIATRAGRQYGLNREDCEDLLQELRLALWKAGPERVVNDTWVFHTARNRAIKLYRARKHRAEITLDEVADLDSLADPTADNDELPHLLRARLARMPIRVQRFYAFRYQEGRSQREVARRMNLCRTSVRRLDIYCQREFGRVERSNE